jgi:CheY-like chemotaxis protein
LQLGAPNCGERKAGARNVESFEPYVVFSDVSMPGMDGYELVRRIRERKDLSRVNLVAMTVYGQPFDREMAFRAGIDHPLTKPVALQRLRDVWTSCSPLNSKFKGQNLRRENKSR